MRGVIERDREATANLVKVCFRDHDVIKVTHPKFEDFEVRYDFIEDELYLKHPTRAAEAPEDGYDLMYFEPEQKMVLQYEAEGNF